MRAEESAILCIKTFLLAWVCRCVCVRVCVRVCMCVCDSVFRYSFLTLVVNSVLHLHTHQKKKFTKNVAAVIHKVVKDFQKISLKTQQNYSCPTSCSGTTS